ncbi:glycosyltransferase family 4 protein [Aeromonas veronii]|uniref:glycosyltransferase family 4 protein n=1 Tax=Aeromonas veronii TaxID=654 RepID=UPI0038B4F92D
MKKRCFNLAFIGRLDRHQKGLDFLTDVMKIVSERDDKFNYKLDVIGDGPYKNELIEQLSSVCNYSSNFSFCFHGWVENASNLMSQFDLIILPSRVEGIPTVLIEAIKNKVNIVAFNIDGVNKVLGPESLVTCFDTSMMADRIIDFCLSNIVTGYDKDYVDMLLNKDRFISEVFDAFNLSED